MNGIHDLGGMDGFGAVVPQEHEPVFHERWEARMFAIASALLRAGVANVDEFRRAIANRLTHRPRLPFSARCCAKSTPAVPRRDQPNRPGGDAEFVKFKR